MQITTFNIKRFILTFCVLLSTLSYSQEQKERPKVGLVLSGGGAKGFAHVGVLKVLEEHHIPIDYIAGTSIGAIVGGLYSIGYTSQQLEDMVLSQDWEAMFVDAPERIYMPFYEKIDQKRYQVSMKFEDSKLIIPNYALSNNGIIKLFSDMTLGYHDVKDFNELPIPFLCVAVDLQTGEEVSINSGSLSEAMAASMALPGIFPNVKKDSMVLVDGGLRNNLPVDQVREMGADIVIGVDVGSAIKTAEELDNFSAIVDQLMTILGNEKFVANREDCDIYILPEIGEYTAADFNTVAGVDLIANGKQKAEEQIDEIISLEKKFAAYEFDQHTGYVGIQSSEKKVITEFDISGTTLSDGDVLGIMGINEKKAMQCGVEELEVALEKLHGSMRFSEVRYELQLGIPDSTYYLHLDLIDNSESFINFGARYNTQDAVSLLFNGTFNNLLFNNSRISMDVKISEVPAFNLRYNVNRGSLPGLGIQYGYRRRSMFNYDGVYGVGEGDVAKRYYEIVTNSVIEDYFTVGIGARYEIYKVKNVIGDFLLESDTYNYLLYRAFLEIDTKDKAYYPTSGIKCYMHTDIITDNGIELNDGAPSVTSFLNFNHTISPNNYWSLTTSIYGQLQYVTSNSTPILYNAYVGGGSQPDDIVPQIPFWGLQWGEYRADNVLALAFENRFQVADKHYVYLNGNVLANTASLNSISASTLDYRWGMAVGYSYNSLIGPVDVYVSLSDEFKLGTYIGIGYYF